MSSRELVLVVLLLVSRLLAVVSLSGTEEEVDAAAEDW